MCIRDSSATGQSAALTGSFTGSFIGDGANLTGVAASSFNLDALDALGGASVDQADNLLVSDAGTEKKVTFSNLEDTVFGNVSGDGTIAAGGALTLADGNSTRTNLGLAIGTDVQAFDAQLSDVAGLAVTDGGFIVGDGSNFVLETGATARTSIGLGTGDSPTFTDLTLSGNLTVNGTTTTIDSTTLVIEDPLLTLAKNNSGGAANTFDQGLFFNRGSDDNVSFIWDESADQFAFAVTSGEDGTTAGNVTIDSYANLQAGTGTFANVDGILGANTAAAATVTTLDTTGNVTFNDAGAAVDFRVEGDTDTDLFVVDGSADQIGISTAAGSIGYVLDASGSTDAFRLPSGNTAARPTAATGIIRFNSQTGKYEGSTDGSTYVEFAIAGSAPTFTKETATGDGSTTTITGFFSSAPESANNVFVYIDNVYQEPTENYTVSGTNITFTSAPHSGARIFAITGADGTSLVTGGVARSETSSVNFTSTATTIMSFNAATYRSAEIFIQLQDTANTEYSAMKGVVVHDGTTAYVTVFGITNTGSSDLATITATHDGSNTVNVQAVSTGGQTAAKVQYSLAAA